MYELIPVGREQLMPAPARNRAPVPRERAGTGPEAVRLDNGYRVRLAAPRAVLKMDRRCMRSAPTWSYGSAFLVDGARVELARDLEQFVAIWHNHNLRTRLAGATHYARPRDAGSSPLGQPLDAVPPTVEVLRSRHRLGVAGCDGSIGRGYREWEWRLLITAAAPGGRCGEQRFGALADPRTRRAAWSGVDG
jgi:hypothetical protein